MTIILTDSQGIKRCITVTRGTRLAEVLRRNGDGFVMAGDRMLGPESYNHTLEQLGINSGADVEIIGQFQGGS
jgi:hypothetical protein